MKTLPFLALCLAVTCGNHSAQKHFTWQPSPGHTQIPIWPGTPPDARPTKFPITAWPQLVETWLHTIGILSN